MRGGLSVMDVARWESDPPIAGEPGRRKPGISANSSVTPVPGRRVRATHAKRSCYGEPPQGLRDHSVKKRGTLCLHRISKTLGSIGRSLEDDFSYSARSRKGRVRPLAPLNSRFHGAESRMLGVMLREDLLEPRLDPTGFHQLDADVERKQFVVERLTQTFHGELS